MPAPTYPYQNYEFDRVESAFKSILLPQAQAVASQSRVYIKREKETIDTPRVELVLKTQQSRLQRAPANLFTMPTPDMRWLPLITWDFVLTATVVTNRSDNGEFHLPLCGVTRYAFQMYRLLATWLDSYDPYHGILDIYEAPIELAISEDENLDMTSMNFAGMLCIKNSSWR